MADSDNLMAALQMQRLRRQNEAPNSVLCIMMIFTVMMVSLPISSYFLSKSYVFEGYYGMSSMDSYFYGAIVAVVMVHVVLALFIIFSLMEGDKPQTIKID